MKLIVEVTDPEGKKLSGARVQLLGEDGEVLAEFLSSETGTDLAAYVSRGKRYILREQSAPFGYMETEDVPFTVSDTKKVQTIAVIDRPKIFPVIVQKIDSRTDQALNGAEFTLFDENGQVVEDINGAECTGITAFGKGIEWRIYYSGDVRKWYILETKAPAGYALKPQRYFLPALSENLFVKVTIMNEHADFPGTVVGNLKEQADIQESLYMQKHVKGNETK